MAEDREQPAANVKAFRNDLLVDQAAEELFPTWQQNIEQWN